MFCSLQNSPIPDIAKKGDSGHRSIIPLYLDSNRLLKKRRRKWSGVSQRTTPAMAEGAQLATKRPFFKGEFSADLNPLWKKRRKGRFLGGMRRELCDALGDTTQFCGVSEVR